MMNKYSGTLGDYSYQFLIGYISNFNLFAYSAASDQYQFLIGYISNENCPEAENVLLAWYQFLIGYISNWE